MNIKISLLVSPNTKKVCIKKHLGLFKFYLKSPAIEGKANQEMIETLSNILKIPKTNIELIAGFSSKVKTFSITTTLSIEEIHNIINTHIVN